MTDIQLYERIARLETTSKEQRDDIKEIKADVKLLLESKWKRDGKTSAIAAVMALAVSLIGHFIK